MILRAYNIKAEESVLLLCNRLYKHVLQNSDTIVTTSQCLVILKRLASHWLKSVEPFDIVLTVFGGL